MDYTERLTKKTKKEISKLSKDILPLIEKQNNFVERELIILCIGTDRSTGDSLGPLVGSFLERKFSNIYGTIENPVHATNIDEVMKGFKRRYNNPLIIAVDAGLGSSKNVGQIVIKEGSLNPGYGVGKKLKSVGDISIIGFVNIGGYKQFEVLQSTRLSAVMEMARIISLSLQNVMSKVLQQNIAMAEVGVDKIEDF
jgi:putative sporulation protein YyaC